MEKHIFIAKGAYIGGDVTLGDYIGVWYNAVVRGDTGPITIGDGTNVQDNCTIHSDLGFEVRIGEGVSIGHNAIIHGCAIGDNTIVGMGAIVLSGARIGRNCLIGAGSLVTGKMQIPDNSLAFGNPVKVIRKLTKEEVEGNRQNALHYIELIEKDCRERGSM